MLARVEAARPRPAARCIFEPGRSLVGNAGVLLTRVEFLKPGEEKNFAIVDAAMNDLARPAMYEACHAIDAGRAARRRRRMSTTSSARCARAATGSARDRELAVEPGDLLAICSAGAYGFVMSSNYNTRARAAEVMVDGDTARISSARTRRSQAVVRRRIDSAGREPAHRRMRKRCRRGIAFLYARCSRARIVNACATPMSHTINRHPSSASTIAP